MCVVSMVGDYWKEDFLKRQPSVWQGTIPLEYATKSELEALRAELESLKKLLKAAKVYDEEMGEPDCEVDEKVTLIKKLAEALEVDLEGIF